MKNSIRTFAIEASPFFGRSLGMSRYRRCFFPMWKPFFQPRKDWFRLAIQDLPHFMEMAPRYDIKNSKESWEIEIDVPGMEAEDINVSLEQDGSVLTVSGERARKEDDMSHESNFSQSFGIDPSVEIDRFVANLKNGVLKISAPKDLTKMEESVKKIPINDLSGSTIEANGEDVTVNKEEK